MLNRLKKYLQIYAKIIVYELQYIGNFVVLYIPNEENSTVTVLRVIYGGRDIDAELQN